MDAAIGAFGKGPEDAAPTELRLAFGIDVEVSAIIFQDVESSESLARESARNCGLTKSRSSPEVWYCGKFAMGRAHQAADRQVEARRAVLPLVVTVRDEVDDLVLWSGRASARGPPRGRRRRRRDGSSCK